ncbi:MAG: PAS domain S-box protein [Hyphomicrobiaceae bacterium]
MRPSRWRWRGRALLDGRRWTIPGRLIAMMIAVALPLNAVVGGAIWHLALTADRSQRNALQTTAEAVASGLDAKLGTYLAVAQGLSRTPSLMAEDLRPFAEEADRAFANLPDAWVFVSDPGGQQLLNFSRTGSAPLPAWRSAPSLAIQKEAFDRRQVIISGVYLSERYRDWIAVIEVPLFKDGKAFRSLSVALKARSFSKLLHAQGGRAGMIIGITDGAGRVVARMPELDRFIGVPATPQYRAIQIKEGIYDLVSLDGNSVVLGNAVSGISPWTVSVAIDKGVLRAATWQTVRWTAISAGLISLLSLLLALAIARQISRPLAELSREAAAIESPGEPQPVAPPPEIADLRTALQQAAAAREEALVNLKESEARFRTIFETAQEGIWVLDRDGDTLLANPRLIELLATNEREMLARALIGYCFEEDAPKARQWLDASLGGENQQFEFRFRRSDGSPVQVLAATAPLRASDGSVVGVLGGFLDLTERKRAEERQRLMMRELSHRGKNLLAVVQAIAGRTLTGQRTLEEASGLFLGRLHALANTYGTLVNEGFAGAPLSGIASAELQLLSGRADAKGPPIMLTARAAQTMALIIHELATNASKYGALSVPAGRVKLRWRTQGRGPGERLVLTWRETSGPPVEAPQRRGFGSALLSSVAEADLSAKTEVTYAATGFSYLLDAPLSAVGTRLDDLPLRRRLQSDTLIELYDAWIGLGGADKLPSPDGFDQKRFASLGALTIAEVTAEGEVQFREVGRALIEHLGDIRVEELVAETPEALQDAYARCAAGGVPRYEHLRFGLSPEEDVTFERLLVPFSADRRRVTQVAGLVVFSGQGRSTASAGRAQPGA